MKKDKEWLLTELRNINTTDNNNEFVFGYETAIDLAVELIDQMDEPEKVIIPQFVEDWLKLRKKEFKSITKAVYFLWSYGWDNNTHIDYKMAIWMERNGDTFARAWLDYPNIEVEKEPLYYVKFIDNSEATYLNQRTYERTYDGTVFLSDTSENKAYKTKFTESEIKAIDERYWQFAVPVEDKQ